jgi:uncharacterized membrane protein
MKKDISKIVKAAMTSLIALSTTTLVNTSNAATDANVEKCYGIAKAGMNDCHTAKAACAGLAKADKQADAYILLAKGTCKKIVGASLTPETDMDKK